MAICVFQAFLFTYCLDLYLQRNPPLYSRPLFDHVKGQISLGEKSNLYLELELLSSNNEEMISSPSVFCSENASVSEMKRRTKQRALFFFRFVFTSLLSQAKVLIIFDSFCLKSPEVKLFLCPVNTVDRVCTVHSRYRWYIVDIYNM